MMYCSDGRACVWLHMGGCTACARQGNPLGVGTEPTPSQFLCQRPGVAPMPATVTLNQLRRLRACPGQLALFKQLFGEAVTVDRTPHHPLHLAYGDALVPSVV